MKIQKRNLDEKFLETLRTKDTKISFDDLDSTVVAGIKNGSAVNSYDDKELRDRIIALENMIVTKADNNKVLKPADLNDYAKKDDIDNRIETFKKEENKNISDIYIKNANEVIDEAMLKPELQRKVNYRGEEASMRQGVTFKDLTAVKEDVTKNTTAIAATQMSLANKMDNATKITKAMLSDEFKTDINNMRSKTVPLELSDFSETTKEDLQTCIDKSKAATNTTNKIVELIQDSKIPGETLFTKKNSDMSNDIEMKTTYSFKTISTHGVIRIAGEDRSIPSEPIKNLETRIESIQTKKMNGIELDSSEALIEMATQIIDIENYELWSYEYNKNTNNYEWKTYGTDISSLVGQFIGNPEIKELYYVVSDDTIISFMNQSKSVDADVLNSALNECLSNLNSNIQKEIGYAKSE